MLIFLLIKVYIKINESNTYTSLVHMVENLDDSKTKEKVAFKMLIFHIEAELIFTVASTKSFREQCKGLNLFRAEGL